jgi:CheY-like chemotaxis protein
MWGTRERSGYVLVIDDEPHVARSIALVLSNEHEVVLEQDATDALSRIARGERYDVILCDIMMPVMSGAELYSRIREIAPEEAARIVFITGGTYVPEVRRFLDSVPNVALEKPFDPDALRAFVSRRVRAQRSGTPSATSSSSHLLVVDDDEAERVVIATILGEEGYQVKCVVDGEQALLAMNQDPLPSLVILDLMMPRMSGWQVLAAMNKNPRLAGVPVVVLTAFDTREGLPQGRQVVHKPIDPDVLLDLTRTMLAQEQHVAWELREPPSDLLPRLAEPRRGTK